MKPLYLVAALTLGTGAFGTQEAAAMSSVAGLMDSPAYAAPAPVQKVSSKTFLLVSPFPFAVDVRILGSGAGFPKVVRVPAPPAAPIPIPYPNINMQIQIKKPTGGWSNSFTLKWKPGNIALPFF